MDLSGWGPVATVVAALIAIVGVTISTVVQRRTGRETAAAAERSAEAAHRSADAAQISAASSERSSRAAEEAIGLNRETAAGDARRAEASSVAKRYQDATTQLGDESPTVRLAGVHAMARLADDWEERRQSCVDVLCAYLRMPWPSEAGKDEALDRNDVMVRQAILATISDHLRAHNEVADWSKLYFDFNSATFRNLRLEWIAFESTPNFTGTRFEGTNVFSHCLFLKGAAFDHCHVTGTLVFEGITVAGDHWISPQGLRPSLHFDYAHVEGSGSLLLWPDVISEDAKVFSLPGRVDGLLRIIRHDMLEPCGNIHFEGWTFGPTARIMIETAITGHSTLDETFRYVYPPITFLWCKFEKGVDIRLDDKPMTVKGDTWRVPAPRK
jgi:hypothetical protein